MSPAIESASPALSPAAAQPAGLDAAVSTQQLSKKFGKRMVVDAIDLRVPRGSVFGFLGPNGSGKTTTIRMLLGLISPTAGSVTLLGHDYPQAAEQALHRVGALVEGPAFHGHLSGRANLRRLDAADRWSNPRTCTARVDAALERVGLTAAADKRFRIYSLGMKQRLAIAAALLQPRDLLVLDEPTNGLDPQGTREVRHLVADLGRDGVTVLISSHLLSEVEHMCSHVGVMSAGKLVAQGRVDELAAGQRSVRVVTPDPQQAADVLRTLGVEDLRVSDDAVTGAPTTQASEDLVSALVAAGVRVRGFRDAHAALEELFVQLTGEGFDVRG